MLINADMQKQKAPPALAGRAFRVIKLHVMLNLFQHLKQTLKQVQGDELYLTTSFTVLVDLSVTMRAKYKPALCPSALNFKL